MLARRSTLQDALHLHLHLHPHNPTLLELLTQLVTASPMNFTRSASTPHHPRCGWLYCRQRHCGRAAGRGCS